MGEWGRVGRGRLRGQVDKNERKGAKVHRERGQGARGQVGGWIEAVVHM